MGVGLGRELEAGLLFGVAAATDLVKHLRIVGRVADDRDVGPVLGSRAQHRRTADVDVLDGVLHLHVGPGDRLAERVEVHADHVDELDAVLAERLQVLGIVAAGQQAAVYFGMEGLDAAVADLREARHVADVDHLDAALPQQFHRAARGDDLPPEGTQFPGEIDNAGLIAYAD